MADNEETTTTKVLNPSRVKNANPESKWVTDEAFRGITDRINAINLHLDELTDSLYPALEQGEQDGGVPSESVVADKDNRAPILVALGEIHAELNKINFRIGVIKNRVTL